MVERNPLLVIVDGNSIAYRAFFALPPLTDPQGRPSQAVYGFAMMLLRLLEQKKPTHMAVAFDKGKQTFRHEWYADYKGTREKTPDDLVQQFPYIRELLEAFSIPYFEIDQYEADDIIGTLSRQAEEEGLPTLIVSGDKDLLQLVTPTVRAALTKKGVTDMDEYDEDAVYNRFQLSPKQIVDLKGLMGDPSDHIPGVPGVGEKTAIKLLQTYETVENVLLNKEEVSGNKLRERLTEHAEQALLSKRLATIHRHVPLDVPLSKLEYPGYDVQRLKEAFHSYGFRSLIDKISGEMTTSTNPDKNHVETSEVSDNWTIQQIRHIETRSEWSDFLNQLADPLGILFHFSDKTSVSSEISGVMLASSKSATFVSFEKELDMSDLQEFFNGPEEKVTFNVKEMAVLLDAHGITLYPDHNFQDVMLAGYLLNPSEGELTLEQLAERELSLSFPKNVPVENELLWLGRRAHSLVEMLNGLLEALSAQEMDDLYRNVEMPLAFVLAGMEVCGFRVDEKLLKEIGKELDQSLQALTKTIYQMAGTEFNIQSPKQLGEILFDKLGLPAEKKTKTGYSTAADVLERLAPTHEIVQNILDYRQLSKLKSTYVEGLLKVIHKDTGRIHTRFHQALTATGRLSSSDPNLQNIPIRMEEGRRLRKAFLPTYPDWKILSADYSQIELRVLAHLSGDEALIEAFRQDMDIHTRTAADVFEVSPDQVTPLMRRQAKAVNFGIVYGISDFGLAQNLNISRKEANRFIENYFSKFPQIYTYMQETVEEARKRGYVTTLLNRRRYLPDIHHKNYTIRSFAERTAMNTPIQGTAADIIKLAMVRMDHALKISNLHARMLLQVHDELIFECPQSEVVLLSQLVKEQMETSILLTVPLKVDVHVGGSWYDAK
ncbi:DNA polymerase I [Alicyclobacillus tolerans]|uniref:DNA polymerase I n=1 Tax=Alicyclobacillus tolerans TaxID=90970 RepID=A0ABT9LUJ4_9BACL|nr:DNA polymerase I [Alicyclobacillus tengchongensis]MDP9727938.1 DNA polymerase-1 [Alicyclobacillus tengchongensis]